MFRPPITSKPFILSMNMDFLTLITRVKDEPFIDEFVKHYFNEGVDKIYIMDDNSSIPFSTYVVTHPNVIIQKIHKFKQGDMMEVKELYTQIRSNSTWFILVDADEYITTKKNLSKTIRNELQSTFKDVDCIKVPWVMMAWNGKQKEPNNLLIENIYRMNHDLKHPHPSGWEKGRCRYDSIEFKPIFKGSKYHSFVNTHMPLSKTDTIIVNSINKNISSPDFFFNNLREHKIQSGFLVCYHYRFTSNDCCKRKIETFCYHGYKTSINNLLLTDYPEIIDETMKNKVLSKQG